MEARGLSVPFNDVDINDWGLGAGGKTQKAGDVITAQTLGGHENRCGANGLGENNRCSPMTNKSPARFKWFRPFCTFQVDITKRRQG